MSSTKSSSSTASSLPRSVPHSAVSSSSSSTANSKRLDTSSKSSMAIAPNSTDGPAKSIRATKSTGTSSSVPDMDSSKVPQSSSSTAVARNSEGKVSPAIKTSVSRSSVPVRNYSKAPKVSMGAKFRIESTKIGSLLPDLRSWILLWQVLRILLTRSFTYSSAVRSGSKFPPEAGKQTAEGKMVTLKTSGSTDDKFSRNSSEVGILPTGLC